jgi:hypothetical protein
VRFPLPSLIHKQSTIEKSGQPKVAVPLKPAPNQDLKWGERPVGGPAARGAWGKFKKDAVEPELPGLVRGTDQAQGDQHGENRDAGYGNHRRPRSY